MKKGMTRERGHCLLARSLTLLLAAGLAACTASAPPPDLMDDEAPPEPVGPGGIVDDIFARVNAVRRQSGQPILRERPELDELARQHSLEMATGKVPFGHTGYEKRLAAAVTSVGGRRGAENVTYQRRPAEEVAEYAVARWMGSDRHRLNLLGGYSYAGAAAVRAEDGRWFVTWIVADGG
ncbi:MAG: CAP domain-containing protein [Deltaproteobacteria bacterium]|nr:CAP domain-containing protein [Deltaproteobacteria bacterium]